MPAGPADSAILGPLFGDAETARLFSDSAQLRAMLLVEGALARVQGELGLIPAEAAAFIDRASREVQIDPAALGAETARNGVPVPALLTAFRKAAEAPEPMQYLHWGATSQDIMDSAQALILRRVLDLWDARLTTLLAALSTLADRHADLPMAGRTYGQNATPTSFGAVVAAWGWPLIDWRRSLADLRPGLLQVSLSGAAGTLSAMGPSGPDVRAGLAKALGLNDPGHSWHTDRSGLARLAGWVAGLAAGLGKIGEDLLLLTQSGLAEVSLGTGGGSSTMPQKQNPVGPSAMVALSRHVVGLAPLLTGAGQHRQQRDGAAWFTEWLVLPQLCQSLSRLLGLATQMADQINPDAKAMARNLEADNGLIHAEALSFVLARQMPRPEAQAAVKTLCAEARQSGRPLADLAAERFPEVDWPDAVARDGLGQAPAEARAFARAV